MSVSEKHSAPRGVRAMAVVRWGLLAGVTTLAAVTMWSEWGPGAEHVQADEARYYCAMHPQIRSAQPGECPICHMRLELIPRERRGSAVQHGDAGSVREVRIESTADAGTSTVAATRASTDGGARSGTKARASRTAEARPQSDASVDPVAVRFHCPMHPHVRSAEAGRCPICGMDLVPIPRESSSLAPPPGLVEVMVTLERRQLSGIVTVPVERAPGRTSLRAPGLVEIPEGAVAQVHARAPGYVERIAVAETGTRVRRGQTLAWIYSPEVYQAQQELLAATRWSARPGALAAGASTSVEMAGATRQRLALLGLSRGDIDSVIARGAPIRATPLRAPRAGHVLQRGAVLGVYAMPETVLYEIADLSRVWVVASISEGDLASARAATRVTFRLMGATSASEAVEARIALVEPLVDESTRTARVRLVLDNARGELRPGQLGDVLFELGSATALLVPRDAVMDTGEHRYVFVDRGDGAFAPRAVRTGALIEHRWELLEGVAEGERVVTRGAFLLDAESRLSAALAQEQRGAP